MGSKNRALKLIVPMLVGALLLAVGLLFLGGPCEADCARILREVQALNLPVGTHPNLTVPSFKSTSAQQLTAQILSDGRIVLLIKTSIGWKRNYDGYVYASAPLLSGEQGTDYYGRPEINLNLDGTFPVVSKKYNASFYRVYFDLN